MAATGKTPILLYGSTTATNQPSAGNLTNSSDGCEIAINVADKNLFFKDSTNAVNIVPIRQSSGSSDGWLSSANWTTFNSKQAAYTNLTSIGSLANATGWLYNNGSGTFSYSTPSASDVGAVPTSRTVSTTSPLAGGGALSSNLTLSITQATTSTNGYLSSTDWNTFNNKQPAGTYVTSVTGTAPVVSSGGTTPAISMAAANGSTNGYLTSTDWTTFNNKQAAGSYAVTNAGQTFTGVQKFTNAIVGGSSNVNFEILGANAYSAIGVGPGISRACKIAPVSDSGYVGWQFSSLDTFTNSSQLPSDASLIADILKVNALNNNVEVQTGNLVIGTSGKGIDFSATAGTGTSELLADYEEGTWTPSQGAGLTVVGSFSSSGTYTKVGRQVTIVGIISGSTSVAVSAGGEFTSSLPYAPANAVSGGAVNSNADKGSQLYVGTIIYSINAIAASASFRFSATYFV